MAKSLLVSMVLLAVAANATTAVTVPECAAAPERAGYVLPDRREAIGDWTSVISACLEPLTQSFDRRWPLVLWDSGPPELWDVDSLRRAAERGLVPAIRIESRYLPLAALLQDLDLPVIVVEGRGGNTPWPYGPAAADDRDWALQFADEEKVPEHWLRQPVPIRFDGWARAADELRRRLGEFVAAGIRIDAFWMDYETQPAVLELAAVKAAIGGADQLPPGVTSDAMSFGRYRRQLWLSLVSAYVAGPIREAYPQAAVTNWIATISTPDHPVLSWRGEPHAPNAANLLTHTNPVAYGIDLGFNELTEGVGIYRPRDVDWIYLHLLLRQVSADAENRRRVAPYLGSVAWVARWVADMWGRSTPVMSRSLYREALRHLWLRDLDAMAVFNPQRPGYAMMQLAEVQDAARVYREMLPHLEQLNDGSALTFEVPNPYNPGLVWSGVADAEEALIRIFNAGSSVEEVEVLPWPNVRLVLVAPHGGISYRLRRGSEGELSAETWRSD